MAESIRIERSLDQVWSVFTDVTTWKTWWGGDLQAISPGWQTGAKMTWAGGSEASLYECIEKKRVIVWGSYGEKLFWNFSSADGADTSVSMGEDLSAAGLVATSAAARAAEFRGVLRALKQCVESKYPIAALPYAKAN